MSDVVIVEPPVSVCSLGGELIKMQIVVLSKIRAEADKGKPPYQAILDGGTSKVRPVCMVVFTTVLGMIPLLLDPFFGALAACVMFGLAFAAVLCLIVTPVLYAIFFNVREGNAPAPEPKVIPRPGDDGGDDARFRGERPRRYLRPRDLPCRELSVLSPRRLGRGCRVI